MIVGGGETLVHGKSIELEAFGKNGAFLRRDKIDATLKGAMPMLYCERLKRGEPTMSTTLRLHIDEYETMIANGAFVGIQKRIEFIEGEIREMSPAGPVHDEFIDVLVEWSFANGAPRNFRVRTQSGLIVGGSLPEPDVFWLKPKTYGAIRPSASDALLVIEVAESSLTYELTEKAELYCGARIPEYWVIDIRDQRLHRHLDPSPSGYRSVDVLTREQRVAPVQNPSAVLELAKLFSID